MTVDDDVVPDTQPTNGPPSREEFSALERKVEEESKKREAADRVLNEKVDALIGIAGDIKKAATGVLANPLVRYVLLAAGVGLWFWLKSKGVNLPNPLEVLK